MGILINNNKLGRGVFWTGTIINIFDLNWSPNIFRKSQKVSLLNFKNFYDDPRFKESPNGHWDQGLYKRGTKQKCTQ